MRIRRLSPLTLGLSLSAALALDPRASAQEGKPIDIDVTTSRVGPTAHQRAVASKAAEADEADATVTEDNLPPKGNKKRIPGLQIIARRYVGGKLWPEACLRFDQIVEEGGKEAMDDPPDAKKNAGRAYFECAERAFTASDFEKVEALLKKSESFIPSDERHKRLRRKIQKESYRKSVVAGDLDKAMAGYTAYQGSTPDEDERIWMGEQLAKSSWDAYRAKDKARLDKTLALAKKVAPMNAEVRKLDEQINDEDGVLGRLILSSLALLAGVGALSALARWRAKSKLEAMAGGSLGGKKNKFLEDE